MQLSFLERILHGNRNKNYSHSALEQYQSSKVITQRSELQSQVRLSDDGEKTHVLENTASNKNIVSKLSNRGLGKGQQH